MRRHLKRKRYSSLLALGEAIRNRRVELLLTQEEIGGLAFLHRTYVTDIENGARNLSYLTLQKVVVALGCPLSQIVIDAERIELTDLKPK